MGVWAAHKLDSTEDTHPAREQHGIALQTHRSRCTVADRGPVPELRTLTHTLVVNVIKNTVLRHEQRVTLKRALQTPVRLHIVIRFALALAHFAPTIDAVILVRLHYVTNILLRVDLPNPPKIS